MRLNRPLDKILNSEIKTRVLRIFCQNRGEMNGRQIARMAGVTPKTAHEILQVLLGEGILAMRSIGKTYLFCLNEDRLVVKDILRPLFAAENALKERLFNIIRTAIDLSDLKGEIISVAVFGSIHDETERPTSDVDLLVVVKKAASKRKTETLFSQIDRQVSSSWGNPIAPYINGLVEFKANARKKEGPVPGILQSYQLIYGDRLEKILR